jgi:lipoprotein-anchoring transpeptidase ErfK/SrfK
MKRGLSVALLAACAGAGVLAAYALAGEGVPTVATTTTRTTTTTATTTVTTTAGTTTTTAATTTVTTTTTAATTTAATTTTTTTTRTVPKPKVKLLPEGVTVGGVPVGNLLPADAAKQLRRFFASPLRLTLDGRVFKANPAVLAAPQITKALARAKKAHKFANLPLAVTVRTARVRAYVAKLATKIDGAPVDSRLLLRSLQPYLTADRPGTTVVRPKTVTAMVRALRLNLRVSIPLPTKRTPAAVRRSTFGPVVVIRRGSNRLYLYSGMLLVRIFAVATGQTIYPTPLGAFRIVVKWKNPWWYPPNSPWAAGEKPIPPGPSNPLGTRWMGLSAPGVGIHGTNNDASIGYSVSHGCIRMHVPDAEWLFNRVNIGTTVFIVAA